MKKILITALSLISIHAYAYDTHVEANIPAATGKVNKRFDAPSSHAFYANNTSSEARTYSWVAISCIMHNGVADNCLAQNTGQFTLQPNESKQFSNPLVMHLQCFSEQGAMGIYARSSMVDNKHNVWEVESKNIGRCE